MLFSRPKFVLWLPFVCCTAVFAQTPLEKELDAHGGLAVFQRQGTLEYDLSGWPFSQNAPLSDHEIIDLKTHRVLITGKTYRLGFDGRDAWVVPNPAALGAPIRFRLFTPSSLAAMPFALADPTVRIQDLGRQAVGPRAYDAYRITFASGPAGAHPEDYRVFFDTATHRLALVNYPATSPLRRARGGEPSDRQAAVFDEWQESNELWAPRKVSFFAWTGRGLGAPLGSALFNDLRYHAEPSAPEMFAIPAGAVIDSSHKP
jgi:hypothetical protein